MIVLIAILLALIPAIVILYPFLRGQGRDELLEDERSTHAELARRWDAALAGLKSAELELALGNLAEEDYQWLREQNMTEAALVMKAMELEEEQEQELLTTISREVAQVRLRAVGQDGAGPSIMCPHCSAIVSQNDGGRCSNCGQSLAPAPPEISPGPNPTGESIVE